MTNATCDVTQKHSCTINMSNNHTDRRPVPALTASRLKDVLLSEKSSAF